jgi:NADH:ubiquinone oxidoreductase subunit 5 (subunit L)/multisubunit Na+/H+ antiporter MnhA subunit
VELARLIMWSMFFFLMFIVLLHLISVLFKWESQGLIAEVLLELFNFFPLLISVVGILVITKYAKNWVDLHNVDAAVDIFFHKLYYDWIIGFDISEKFMNLFYFMYKIFDKGVLEVLGPDGLTVTVWNFLKDNKKYTSGYLYNYICIFLIGLLLIISIAKYFF